MPRPSVVLLGMPLLNASPRAGPAGRGTLSWLVLGVLFFRSSDYRMLIKRSIALEDEEVAQVQSEKSRAEP